MITTPLKIRGRDIVDADGKRFKLASVNWYGASDEQFIPGGLDVQHRSSIADAIRRMEFNSVRLPYSDEMVLLNPLIPSELLSANRDLVGSRALDVYEAVVNNLTEAGLAVIINNHITQATWCCGINPCDAGWSNSYLGGLCRVEQTEDQWIENWETAMKPFVDNYRVVGADLRNEVRGLWGTMKWKAWAKAAGRA
ncbi:Endoglucanase E1 [Lachnellula suecica]|uniref:Endoglucanase E1 n=1 Tax=Lachnellula suecica TaxID=602035 RepID=A0A8T9C1J0_9HELO|nr:Endoglucanase E1 [Lachnellula suecica]